MITPTDLQHQADALPEHGEPPYPERRRIRQEIVGQSPAALINLEVLCARRALPVWQNAFPDNHQPEELLDKALREPQPSGLADEWQQLKTDLDNLFEMGEDFFPGIYAGFACWAVVRDLIGCQPAEPDVSGELEVEPDSWSPCFFASLAESGGAVWEPVGDPVKRRDYWQWYLLDAIPSCLPANSSPT